MLRGQFNGAVLQQVGRLFRHGTVAGLSEPELLERFVACNDDGAFEALMARHGPMVLGVCRQLLHDPNDVDDAFQATFLILVRKAGTLRQSDLLGNWLYGVAYRVATRARVLAARRTDQVASFRRHVQAVDSRRYVARSDLNSPESRNLEWKPDLHREVNSLPEKYRVPIVLCYFEGLTHEQAAARLGCPLGTVKGRLTRARELLQRRLSRRGIALTSVTLASDLAFREVEAAVPAALEHITLKAAQSLALHAGVSLSTITSISVPISSLVQGVSQAMMFSHLRNVVLPLLLAAGTVATGVVVGASQLSGGPTDGLSAEQAVNTPADQKSSTQAKRAARQDKMKATVKKASAQSQPQATPGGQEAAPER